MLRDGPVSLEGGANDVDLAPTDLWTHGYAGPAPGDVVAGVTAGRAAGSWPRSTRAARSAAATRRADPPAGALRRPVGRHPVLGRGGPCAKVSGVVKACPFCAELIQERAVKCRFCGEWLDPSARPSWSTESAPAAAPAANASAREREHAPDPRDDAESQGDPSPATTATDGSTTRPLRSWSTPPWLAEREGASAIVNTPVPTPTPIGMSASGELGSSGTVVATPVAARGGTIVSAAAASLPREVVRVPLPEPVAPVSRPAPVDAPVPARASRPAAPERASLEEVALQMERLGHGAAAMRGAVERGPDPRADWPDPAFPSHPRPAPVVHDDDDDLDPRMAAHAPHVADPAEPLHDFEDDLDPLPPRRAAAGVEDAFLGDLDEMDEGGGHDDWGDGELGMSAAPRPLPWVPILGGAALLVLIGAFVFRDALFGAGEDEAVAAESGEAEAKDAGEEKVEVGDPKGAGDAKAEPAEEPGESKAEPADAKAEPAAEGDAKAPAADTKAEPAESGTPPAPAAPLDAATIARLDEARALYTKAEGRKTKLLQQAGTVLDEVLKVAPEHPEALLLKAQVLLETGDMQAALATAQRCTAASAELADCWLTIGVVQQENKEKDLALQAYERYLALAPEGKYARDVRGQVKKLKR